MRNTTASFLFHVPGSKNIMDGGKFKYETDFLTLEELSTLKNKNVEVMPVEADKGGHKKYDGMRYGHMSASVALIKFG